MKLSSSRTVAVLCALVFFAATGAAHAKKRDILGYVPADTPYVVAATKPMPADLADRFEPAVDKMLAAYGRVLRYQLSETMVELSKKDGGAAEAEKMQAVFGEIFGLMSIEGIRGAGIGRDARFVLFGNGLLPVARLELDDVEAFNDAIGRVETRAGKKLPVGEVAGKSFRYLELDKMQLLVAVLDEQAVFAVVPSGAAEDAVATALGLTKPARSIAKSKELRTLAKEYGFIEYMTGFVNVGRVAAAFLGDPSGLNSEWLGMAGYDDASISDVCKAEIASMAAITPRMVFGYTALDKRRIDSRLVVEVREDIARGLMTLPTAVPGLGADPGGFLSFGLGLDPMALRNFYEARLDAMEAEPYECETFAELQSGVAKGRQALAQPIPPIVYSFRGLLANVTDIDADFGSDRPPESIDGSVLLAVENAPSLVTMAAMMDPQVAALNLLPDGKPVRLDLPQLAALTDEAFAALSDGALALSFGAGAAEDAAKMLDADGVEPPPFISLSMDADRYYEMVGEAMMRADESETEEPTPLAVREALRDVMLSSGDLYDRLSVLVRFTSQGIDVTSRMTLSQ
jgi:hypothetical protein